MGGDDSQKLCPGGEPTPLQGAAQTSGFSNINTLAQASAPVAMPTRCSVSVSSRWSDASRIDCKFHRLIGQKATGADLHH
jgi:hypothetical protein